jgi:hypothetical protein
MDVWERGPAHADPQFELLWPTYVRTLARVDHRHRLNRLNLARKSPRSHSPKFSCRGQHSLDEHRIHQHPPFISKMRTFFKNRPQWWDPTRVRILSQLRMTVHACRFIHAGPCMHAASKLLLMRAYSVRTRVLYIMHTGPISNAKARSYFSHARARTMVA